MTVEDNGANVRGGCGNIHGKEFGVTTGGEKGKESALTSDCNVNATNKDVKDSELTLGDLKRKRIGLEVPNRMA